jgi:flagellar biosynthesis/type III secretory pathway protein FliH
MGCNGEAVVSFFARSLSTPAARCSPTVSDPIEQWLYFFAAAEGSTPDELTARLADPVFAEATGVLEMISKDHLERVLYEFRLKAERDEIARTEQAIRDGQEQGLAEGLAEGRQKGLAEGLAEGRDEGELVGRVKALQSLSGITPATSEELLRLGKPALMAMEQELQARLRDRLR